jgi:CMP-N-acetylneuraminic acid synthetase
MSLRILALLPMRHASERVPGKNHRPLNGRPLFHHILMTLLDVSLIDEIVIDTDSELIVRSVGEQFPERVRVVPRPEHLRDGDVAMNDVLLNTVAGNPADWYVQTHSTNPLLRADTISRAIEDLLAHAPENDSLFSVSRLQTRLWWSPSRAVNHDPEVLLRTQDLPPIYEENSNLYMFSGSSLRQARNRIGRAPIMFEIDRVEAWDIDDEQDFVIAEFLQARQGAMR